MEEFSHFRLRLPVNLKEKIEAEAKENKRSINAQLVFILNAFFKAGPKNVQITEDLIEILTNLQDYNQAIKEIKLETKRMKKFQMTMAKHKLAIDNDEVFDKFLDYLSSDSESARKDKKGVESSATPSSSKKKQTTTN